MIALKLQMNNCTWQVSKFASSSKNCIEYHVTLYIYISIYLSVLVMIWLLLNKGNTFLVFIIVVQDSGQGKSWGKIGGNLC